MLHNASLHKAAKYGDLEKIKVLVAAGHDLQQLNIYGRTPLAVALQYGQAEAADLLQRSARRRPVESPAVPARPPTKRRADR